ncbi:craniofacial development protein 2-like [Condylostylus longicornis]|uniref:craniofacial development protein 2-like n=1 Tax=Condylostylus longicornis TaxID=2530218 RepID=UPI00244DC909|nr:craniofacial development protein 2-like [Condylostylus longicornis]
MRWKDKGIINKTKFSMYYSGSSNRSGLYGTGFIISKNLKNFVIGFKPVSDRICCIRLRGKFCLFNNLTFISAYAPTEDADDDVKDDFYDSLGKTLNEVSSHDSVIVLGDFNAKIGKEEYVRNIAGKFSLHETTSPNGHRLCQFAEETCLKIKSTSFERKNIHKGTWKIPGSSVSNQIDHVLISARWASSVMSVRSCRGERMKMIQRNTRSSQESYKSKRIAATKLCRKKKKKIIVLSNQD